MKTPTRFPGDIEAKPARLRTFWANHPTGADRREMRRSLKYCNVSKKEVAGCRATNLFSARPRSSAQKCPFHDRPGGTGFAAFFASWLYLTFAAAA
jgi:hypothetical protein